MSTLSSKPRFGFTLIEVLVVIAIIGVIAAILFPVIASARESAKGTTCLSNLKQLAVGLNLYAQDYNDNHPEIRPTAFGERVSFPMGWAGKLYPFIKSTDVFHCPDDSTPIDASAPSAIRYPVSYGMNGNLSLSSSLSQVASAPKTVWLFEVSGNQTVITQSEEGKAPGLFVTRSAAGDGTSGGILASTLVAHSGPGDGRDTLYATGPMDNSASRAGGDDYKGMLGRHRDGANFLALDGHGVWTTPLAVSAGRSAKNATDPQKNTGCIFALPKYNIFPCAEGTAVGLHKLTFSTN
jgi:prepilin-type N-terminal cleavage/methylation domain-containing protein/prepilin-type processing-associated H-X9-DG protein